MSRSTAWYRANPSKRKEHYDRWKANRPEIFSHSKRNATLISKYGISIEDYDVMFEEQNGLCWCCQLPKKLYVDHDHETNQVRGLLCNLCNCVLGYSGDNPETLRRMIEYLGRGSGKSTKAQK